MTQDRADEIFSTELGQQLGVIYVTSDDKPFIRYEEAVKHRNDLMFENLDNIVDSKIVEWYPENRNKMMGWISVKDRFPTEFEEVLIYSPNDIVKAYLVGNKWKGSILVTDNMKDVNVNDREISTIGSPFDYVTHWMPLPSPPKD
jgi:hypothetical protein